MSCIEKLTRCQDRQTDRKTGRQTESIVEERRPRDHYGVQRPSEVLELTSNIFWAQSHYDGFNFFTMNYRKKQVSICTNRGIVHI